MSGVLDILSISVTVCIFVLIFINGTIVVTSVANGMIAANAITPSMATYPVFVAVVNSIYSADTAVTLLYFGLWIVSIIAAAYLESETINFPLTIFMGVVTIFISFIISNAMHGVMGAAIFSTVISHFQYTQLIMANLGALTTFFVFVYSLVILARPTFTGGAPAGGGSNVFIGP